MPHALCVFFPILLASSKQGFNITQYLIIFVKAQSNGLPRADAGADTASVAKGFIDFNETYR
jgi:hypothetical protein